MSIIQFTVAKNKSGGGLQTTPTSADVLTRDVTLSFTLTADAAKEYELTGYTSTDTQSQLGPAKIDGSGISMTVSDSNSALTTFNIDVTAELRATGEAANADPQIRNIPPD